MDLFRAVWVLIGLSMIVYSLFHRDWFFLIAGFLWNFDDIEIVHYHKGKELTK